MPDFTALGEYLSPLTSPAIEAQNIRHQQQAYSSAPSSETGATTSPLDLSIDPSTRTTPPSPAVRTTRRKPSISLRSHVRGTRQSPTMKAQNQRRIPSSIAVPGVAAQVLDLNAPRSVTYMPGMPVRQVVESSDGSEHDSLSPELLSESIIMPPPAIPRSAGKSPCLAAQSSKTPTEDEEPATPATLMRLENQARSPPSLQAYMDTQFMTDNADPMEDIILPDSATSSRSILTTLDTSEANTDDQATPTMSAKTPKLTAGSTPRTSTMSPQILSPTVNTNHKRSESSTNLRSVKKRQSSSSQMSPSIRPKISPSIKPLIPASSESVSTGYLPCTSILTSSRLWYGSYSLG